MTDTARRTTAAPTTTRSPGRWPRSPVVWIIVAIGGFGVAVLARDYAPIVAVYPGPALLAAALLVLTGLVGWWLLSRIRPIRSAPRGRALACIGWGMTGAIGCAILANTGLAAIWAATAGIEFASEWGDAVTAPINEETLKMAGLVLLVLAVSPWIRGPMEGFTYGSLVGLGFQIVENGTYAVNGIVASGGTQTYEAVLESFGTRVILTGLGSHWAMSAVAGAGIGFLLTRHGSARRTLAGAGLLVLAPLMHAFFDSPLLGAGLVAASKALVNFAIAMAVYFTLRHRLRVAARAALRERVAAANGRPDVLTRRGRRRALAQLPKAERPAAARAQLARVAEAEERAYAAT